ncbi:signal peptidase I [Halorientalis halophila]|uniref:signal peptidase I n=1 Tax=Halorientalis halophila TaxID=3108499 RepID=UPI00300B32A3
MSDRMGALRERAPSRRKVATVLGTLVLLAVVLPFVVFAVPQTIGADHGFVILSGSMEPDIAPGDVVVVDASRDVAVGDVITYEKAGASDGDVPVTHRVIGMQDGEYVTKGDANENADSATVAPENVLGRVVLTIPFIGHVVLWANTPTGYVGLVLVPLVLLLGSELVSWARKGDGDTGDQDAEPAPGETTESTPAGTGAEGGARSTAAAGSPEGPPSVSVAVADLKLSALASLALFAYAAWNLYTEVATVGAPSPVTVGALTAGLLGLLVTGWVTGRIWYHARTADERTQDPTDLGRADWPMPDPGADARTDTEGER